MEPSSSNNSNNQSSFISLITGARRATTSNPTSSGENQQIPPFNHTTTPPTGQGQGISSILRRHRSTADMPPPTTIRPTAAPTTSTPLPPLPISTDPLKIRLVPHLESTRSLRFDPIMRELKPSDPALRIGRFTERRGEGNNNAANLAGNRLAFKSKVVSRGHAEVWVEAGKFMIKDTKSSSGTFLNHVRLAPPSIESRPFPLKDGDILQLGVDFQGGTEDIYKCVKIRVEIGRDWGKGANAFNSQAMKTLRAFSSQGQAQAQTLPNGVKEETKGKDDKKPKEKSDCCICLFTLQICQSLFIAPCSHAFHYKCIRPLLEAQHPGFVCPLCRVWSDLGEDVEVDDASLLAKEEDVDEVEVGGGVGEFGEEEEGVGTGLTMSSGATLMNLGPSARERNGTLSGTLTPTGGTTPTPTPALLNQNHNHGSAHTRSLPALPQANGREEEEGEEDELDADDVDADAEMFSNSVSMVASPNINMHEDPNATRIQDASFALPAHSHRAVEAEAERDHLGGGEEMDVEIAEGERDGMMDALETAGQSQTHSQSDDDVPPPSHSQSRIHSHLQSQSQSPPPSLRSQMRPPLSMSSSGYATDSPPTSSNSISGMKKSRRRSISRLSTSISYTDTDNLGNGNGNGVSSFFGSLLGRRRGGSMSGGAIVVSPVSPGGEGEAGGSGSGSGGSAEIEREEGLGAAVNGEGEGGVGEKRKR